MTAYADASPDAPRVGLAVMRALGHLEVAAAPSRRLSEPNVGIAMDLDGEGALLVETEQGVERIAGGGVAAT